jgi:DnaK suppressor protein
MSRREELDVLQHSLARRERTLRVALTDGPAFNANPVAGALFDATAAQTAIKVHARFIDAQRIELEKLDTALARYKAGQYGVCETCGAEIHVPRLHALPYATTCIACQRKAEREARAAAEHNGQ